MEKDFEQCRICERSNPARNIRLVFIAKNMGRPREQSKKEDHPSDSTKENFWLIIDFEGRVGFFKFLHYFVLSRIEALCFGLCIIVVKQIQKSTSHPYQSDTPQSVLKNNQNFPLQQKSL